MTTKVDGVEVKFTVADAGAALDAYGLREDDGTRREVDFFDTIDPGAPSPRLLAADVVLRVRRKKGRTWTSTLKLRPAVPQRLTGDFAAGSGVFDSYKVEIDWARNRVLSASMDAEVGGDLVDAVLADPSRIVELFGPDQQRLLDEAGSPPPGPFAGLRRAGPIATLRWDGFGDGALAGLRAERWSYLDRVFLELSLRADDIARATPLREVLQKDLADRGIALDSSATSKTETALRELLADQPLADQPLVDQP